MKLAQFIQGHLEEIIAEWETFAMTLLPAAASMTTLALRDHSREILLAVARDMDTYQSNREQKQKSMGHADNNVGSAATVHGELRHLVGFDLIQLVAEFRALRASVLRMWAEQKEPVTPDALVDMTRFNEAIDQAIAESVRKYSEDLGKSSDTFMAILGHDLRSPLGAILMSAHNVASEKLSHEMNVRSLDIIRTSALRMQLMIRDLLDFAGSRLGRAMPMRPEEGNLDRVCEVALNEVMAAHPDRNFEFTSSGDLRGEFDHARIGQVLSNLLNNAVGHGQAGFPVKLMARGEGDFLIADVMNYGKQMPPEALRQILDPLGQVQQQPLTAGSSGLGLGLYIAREVAEAHGGSITAKSPGDQTVFTLRLPRKAAALAPPGNLPAKAA